MNNRPQFSGPRRPAAPAPKPRPGQRPRRGNERNSRDPYVINEYIRAREVRLVGDNV